MAKNQQAVKVDDKVPLYKSNPISYWSETLRKIVNTPLELSVLDTSDNWNKIDYGVTKEVFEDDSAGVKAMMKKLGYYLLNTTPCNGCYFFQHYTNKVK